MPVCNGTWDNEHYDKTRPSYTVGINYEILSNMSVYVRWNTGVHFDDFDNGIRGAKGNFAPLETITNYEGGFKFQNSIAYIDVSTYHRLFTGLQYQETTQSGVPLSQISTYGSNSNGVNFIGTLTPILANLSVVGDYMDGHYTHFNGCAPYIDINGVSQCAQVNGAPLQRQPKFQIRFTPSYTVDLPSGGVTGWVTYEHVGQRYEDITGLQPLGAYYMLDAGLLFNVTNKWEFRLQGTNLTNQIGLTEGNARFAGNASGIGGVLPGAADRGALESASKPDTSSEEIPLAPLGREGFFGTASTDAYTCRYEREFFSGDAPPDRGHAGHQYTAASRRFSRYLRTISSKTIVEANPKFVEALRLLAGTKQALGDMGAAEILLRRALMLDPRWTPTLATLGELLLGNGRGSEAEPLLQRAAAGPPPYPRAALLLARYYNILGRPAQALQVPHLCASGRADAELAAQHIAALSALGRQDEAVSGYRRLADAAPEDPETAHALAIALHAANQHTAGGRHRSSHSLARA